MEKGEHEVLYETRYHVSRRWSSTYPPQHQQQNEGVKGSILSLISARGVSQLREKWTGYRRPRKLKKWISLFVSPRGQYVAVALRNHLTILHKDDDYQEPCGTFSSGSLGTFTYGIWSEAHGVLGVVDDTDLVYFIRANGEEITRITKRHLKVSSPIVGLIPNDDSDINRSFLSSFSVIVSDGSLHEVEVSQNPIVSIRSAQESNYDSNLLDFPVIVYCLSYHQELSLLAVVGAAVSAQATSAGSVGAYCLSLWRRNRNLCLEPVVSATLEGLYSKPEGYLGRLTSPKALVSPEGKFVAVLDLRGNMSFFELDQELSSLSNIDSGENYDSQGANGMKTRGTECLSDIVDFTWWSDQILVLAKRSGIVTMIDVLSGVQLLEKNPVYPMTILERVGNFSGNLFLLECTLSDSTNEVTATNVQHIDWVIEDKSDKLAPVKLNWSLISFLKKSVSEMYDILISNHKYQDALDLASCHGLDKDEVLKAQWLHSPKGVNEINMLLSVIKDPNFVLAECLDKVGATEDVARALIVHGLYRTDQYRFSKADGDKNSHIWDFRVARLKLLQYRDKLETFLGINMGRFSVHEYSKFRHQPIDEAAQALAESGKIGALNLLFKRHPYSLVPLMLDVLAAIPETLPVQSYGQLLPGKSSPSNVALREKDWVECRDMVVFINSLPESHENIIHLRTEPILELCLNISWPSCEELAVWYKNRARDIDSLSGQLDNSLSLIDFACRKGIKELEEFREDISYLLQLIYSDCRGDEVNFTMTLVAWEQLSDYEKFKMMLKDVQDDNVLERLYVKAIPFMHKRSRTIPSGSLNVVTDGHSTADNKVDSFLVRWLKETASCKKLELCLKVIEEGCRDLQSNNIFMDVVEAVDCAIQCIYLCRTMDRWSTMASILSRFAETRDFDENLKRRLKLAEGHVEAGRILSFYQVPKPINFFLDAHSDEKGVKQIIRLILSKFVRRQSGHSDNDWASMWRDLQSLQEKAFPFLDQEYMLVEFCRGLLKAGKFSLARNYLRGTASVDLSMEKAENLVIQAAREYFFSASSLACSEIWKAKECLNLFPNSRSVRTEADIIEALTVKLPSLGVSILPVQFKQINDPMEVIKLAITNQSGVYLNVDEFVEVAKLLGLSSKDDICAVQEAIAREAAVAGDLQQASDLCLALAKKGHGPAWDLCAAMARGPDVDNMGIGSRKQLLGFALSYCDEESIGELLHAWKDLDMQEQCEKLVMLTGTDPQEIRAHAFSNSFEPLEDFPGTVDVKSYSLQVDGTKCNDQEVNIKNIRNIISRVVDEGRKKNNSDWETFLQENGKILSFASVHLPWLLELSSKSELGKKSEERSISGRSYPSPRTQVLVTILSWLARNDFAPRDDLIANVAKSIMEPPVTEEEDIIGSSFLLNLMDAFHGVEVIEEQVKTRTGYNEICSIMSVGMIYSSLHNSTKCNGATQRRQMLLQKFQQKYSSFNPDELHNIDTAQSSFWRDWKLKLGEQKRLADHSRVLEQILPGVDVVRFLSRDIDYMENVVFSLIESVKLERKHILKDVLKVASTYGLNHTKVLLQYLNSVLVSDVWAPDDITAEMSSFEKDILSCASEAIEIISLSVYPAIDGCDKQRLAYIYRLLSDCYLQLEATEEPAPTFHPDPLRLTVELSRFYKVVEQECRRASLIKNLNFKNIVGLHGLNLEFFSSEVYTHVDENNVEVLAIMVENLLTLCKDSVPKDFILPSDVYRHLVFSLLNAFKVKAETETKIDSPEELHTLISQLEHIYNVCYKFIRAMKHVDILDTLRKFFTIIPLTRFIEVLSNDLVWLDCLVFLTNFWLRLVDDVQEFMIQSSPEEKYNLESLLCCLKGFTRVVLDGTISAGQGWGTVISYANHGLTGGFANIIFLFCRALIVSGCGFQAIAEIYSEAVSSGSSLVAELDRSSESIPDITHIYLSILENILYDLATGSSNEHQNLHNLVSSLSDLDGDVEALKMVRHAVWERIAKFSDDLTLPSHVRVYALELLQFISGSVQSHKGYSVVQHSDVLSWEGWGGVGGAATSIDTGPDYGPPAQRDPSSRLTSSLVALKSSQLVKVISPSIEISSEDLSSVESAVCCFLKLCEITTSELHVDALIAIMEEWEGLFTNKRDEADSAEVVGANEWTNDDWDEGWESFQEESVAEETKKDDSLSVHPLHLCWMEIFKKLVAGSRSADLLKLIDQSIVKSNGTLLDEVDTESLCQIVLGSDCFLALKIALLLPYEAIHLHCLDIVEEKLKEGGISDTISRDIRFLILVTSSGLVSTIISKPKYDATFSFLCFVVGSFSRQYQQSELLSIPTHSSRSEREGIEDLSLFVRLIFPCFVSELVKADQQILAGFLVTKFMHTNASLSLINVAEASLATYLQRQLHILESSGLDTNSNIGFDEILRNTISQLTSKSVSLVQSALSPLKTDVR